eukprot:3616897-Amphidinium_carterae.1
MELGRRSVRLDGNITPPIMNSIIATECGRANPMRTITDIPLGAAMLCKSLKHSFPVQLKTTKCEEGVLSLSSTTAT